MSEYKKGDMFVIELDRILPASSDSVLTELWFDVYGHVWAERELKGLDQLNDDFINDRFGILQEYAYQEGIKEGQKQIPVAEDHDTLFYTAMEYLKSDTPEAIQALKNLYNIGFKDGIQFCMTDAEMVMAERFNEKIDAIKAEIDNSRIKGYEVDIVPVDYVLDIIERHCGGDTE